MSEEISPELELAEKLKPIDSLHEDAWSLLANVDAPELQWPHQGAEWREAVLRWKDAYHKRLSAMYDALPEQQG